MNPPETSGAGAPPRLRLRERWAILGGLIGITTLAWLYLYRLTLAMPGMAMDGGGMGQAAELGMRALPRPWTFPDAALMFVMWWVMMIGMMLPSAAPMILTFATINRRKRARGQPYVPTALFSSGYLIAWGGFSLAATAAQWGLEQLALLSQTMMTTLSPLLGGLLFVAAGLYQLTPLKYACLEHCRSPFDFILNRWRDGGGGALAMGIDHGLYCIGCCWVVMALLFVGGVMNLLWVAALAAFVLMEKLVPAGQWVARSSGALMIAFGLTLIATGR